MSFPHRNFPPLNPVENELARNSGSVRGPHSGSTSPAPSCNPTPGPELVAALISALIPALVPFPTPLSSDELFEQFMRAYIMSNQGSR